MREVDVLAQAKAYAVKCCEKEREGRIYYLNRIHRDLLENHWLLYEHLSDEVREKVMGSSLETEFGIWTIGAFEKKGNNVVLEIISVEEEKDTRKKDSNSLVGVVFNIGPSIDHPYDGKVPDIEMVLKYRREKEESERFSYLRIGDKEYVERWGKRMFMISVLISKLAQETDFNIQ